MLRPEAKEPNLPAKQSHILPKSRIAVWLSW